MAEQWHSLGNDEVLEHLAASSGGLSSEEAARRLAEHGPNVLREQAQEGPLGILLAQLKSVVILVLLAALVLAALARQWPETIAVAAVVVINALIGFFSEWRAGRSMAALRAIGESPARVRRDGQEQQLSAAELVPGDVLLLGPEDSVAADARILKTTDLKISEAALTGESVPVNKGPDPLAADTPLAERLNMVYRGTSVEDGQAEAVVVATGDKSEVGRISQLAQQAEGTATPLQRRLDQLGRRLALVVVATAAVVAGVGLLAGQPTLLMIETAVALGIAAVPEGLPVVATIALARGMWIMAQRNALINHLPAVETLGATTVIFTDKTGTLTMNQMSVRQVVTSAAEHELQQQRDGSGEQGQDALLQRTLRAGVLCNKAALAPGEQGQRAEGRGDPTELALLQAGREAGLERQELLGQLPQVREVPFDRETMMMATFHRSEDGLLVAVKGAPLAVLEACDRLVLADGGERALDAEEKRTWAKRVKALASSGQRVLALAERRAANEEEPPYAGLGLLGLVGFFDPPRRDVREAINRCQSAGIKVVMVTGDQPETACAIAEAVGIVGDPGDPEASVMHGRELLPAEQLGQKERQRVLRTNIFARVSPEQKLDLIAAYQEAGATVAMTGDGVNDAPALKKADIGVAMGQRGTDAAKQVADMVLKDDAFQSIVAAVAQGRVIFANIRKSVLFMLCTNGAEVLAVAAASFLGWPLPLRPLQILYLNVLTDVFPALALGVGKGDGSEMQYPPRPRRESIITGRHWAAIGGWSLLIALCVLAGLQLGLRWLGVNETQAVTISFLTLAFGKLFFVFNLRDRRSGMLVNEVTLNPWLWGSLVFCAALLLVAVYLPGLSGLLHTQPLSGSGWGLTLGLSLVPLLVGQVVLTALGRRQAPRVAQPNLTSGELARES